MSKTQFPELIFMLIAVLLFIGLVFLIIIIRRQIAKHKVVIYLVMTFEYLILALWSYNAITYKVGYHTIIKQNWLERNEHYDVLNGIEKPFAWTLLLLLPLTAVVDKNIFVSKKSAIQATITILIPITIITGLLIYERIVMKQYPHYIEFAG